MNYERWQTEAEVERQEVLARKASFFAKWLWILFLMIIPDTIVAIASLDIVVDTYNAMRWISPLLGLACSVVNGIILIKMSEREYQYKIAGMLYIIGNVIETSIELSGTPENWALFILLPTSVLGLVAAYNEFMGHASVMSGIDNVMAEKWRKLWKWFLIGTGSAFGSIVLMLIIPVAGIVALLASAIALAVIAIAKMVYLYRSAKICSIGIRDTSTATESML